MPRLFAPALLALAAVPFLALACSEDAATTPTAADAAVADSAVDRSVPESPADSGPTPTPTDGGTSPTDGGATPSDGGRCLAERTALLAPVAAASTGAVTVLGAAGGVTSLYVDATAGGSQAAAQNPRVYVNLATFTRAAVTDGESARSTAWDLAIKRPILFTNSGDGGPGSGGAVRVAKDFDAVTAADVSGLVAEDFFAADCTAKTDATGAVKTTFDGWYEYNPATNGLAPAAGTWIVRGADGRATYKVRIKSYYGNPDGTVGTAGGRYLLDVAAL